MSPRPLGHSNVFSLKVSEVPLCVECLSCGHRGRIQPAELQRGRNADEMTSLVAVTRRLFCSVCKSRAVKAFIPLNDAEVKAFAAGQRFEVEEPAPYDTMPVQPAKRP